MHMSKVLSAHTTIYASGSRGSILTTCRNRSRRNCRASDARCGSAGKPPSGGNGGSDGARFCHAAMIACTSASDAKSELTRLSMCSETDIPTGIGLPSDAVYCTSSCPWPK